MYCLKKKHVVYENRELKRNYGEYVENVEILERQIMQYKRGLHVAEVDRGCE